MPREGAYIALSAPAPEPPPGWNEPAVVDTPPVVVSGKSHRSQRDAMRCRGARRRCLSSEYPIGISSRRGGKVLVSLVVSGGNHGQQDVRRIPIVVIDGLLRHQNLRINS